MAYAEVVVKDRDREDWWYPEGDLEVGLRPVGEGRSRLVASGRLRLDPQRLAGDRPLGRGVYDVWAFVNLLGIDRMVRVTGHDVSNEPAAGPAVTGGRLALPYWTTGVGQLTLDVDQRLRRLGPDTAGAAAANAERGERSLPLPYVVAEPGVPAPLKVTVSALKVTAELVPAADGSTVRLRLPARLKLPAGRHPVTLPKADAPVAHAVVRDGALLRLEGPAYEAGTGRRLLDAVAGSRQVRRVRRRLGRSS